MITYYVVNVAAIVSMLKLKIHLFLDRSRRGECSGDTVANFSISDTKLMNHTKTFSQQNDLSC